MVLPRLHLFELLDQPWLPIALRRWMTDYLRIAEAVTRPYAPAAVVLGGLLDEVGEREILDLCSGAGGPILAIQEVFTVDGREVDVLLSDKFPTPETWTTAQQAVERVDFYPDPLDATAVPAGLPPVRTVFTALHHFRPAAARQVLSGAVSSGRAVAVFEVTDRRLVTLAMFSLTPLLVLLLTPRIRPLSLWRLVFTYLIPVLPLCIGWDGVVSCLRSHTIPELRALAQEAAPDWSWDAGFEALDGPARMTWLVGREP